MATQVNGETQPSSATLQHIAGYPFFSDAVDTFKNNTYGQKSIQLGDSAYQTFAKPLLPWLARPYQYVSPYVKKVDEFGAGTLDKVDEKLPIIKKPTKDIVATSKDTIFFPLTKSHEIYSSQYQKVGGQGIVTNGKALISTGLVITAETLNWVSSYLRVAKTKAKEVGQEATK